MSTTRCKNSITNNGATYVLRLSSSRAQGRSSKLTVFPKRSGKDEQSPLFERERDSPRKVPSYSSLSLSLSLSDLSLRAQRVTQPRRNLTLERGDHEDVVAEDLRAFPKCGLPLPLLKRGVRPHAELCSRRDEVVLGGVQDGRHVVSVVVPVHLIPEEVADRTRRQPAPVPLDDDLLAKRAHPSPHDATTR